MSRLKVESSSLPMHDLAYVFACDGSYRKKCDRWGWGVTMRINEFRINWSGFGKGCTNNIGELTAMLMVIKKIQAHCDLSTPILVKGDSQYVLKGIINGDGDIIKTGINGWIKNWMRNGWKTANNGNVANKDLWVEIYKELTQAMKGRRSIYFHWVKGHDSDIDNDVADKLSTGEINDDAILEL